MSRYEVLNHDKHAALKVLTERSGALGDAVMSVMACPAEFRELQATYPIMFTKDPQTGAFLGCAMLGLEPEQNLFLTGETWDAPYVPMMVRRQPFLIATNDSGGAVVSIDLDHPRVSETAGSALFDENGEPSSHLKETLPLLEKLHRGFEHNQGFIQALLEHELLENVTVDFTLLDGSNKSLAGYYTIAEERLYQLDGPVLEALNRASYLQPIFMAVASLSHLRGLIERYNRTLQAAAG